MFWVPKSGLDNLSRVAAAHAAQSKRHGKLTWAVICSWSKSQQVKSCWVSAQGCWSVLAKFHRRVVDAQQHSILLLKSNKFSVSKCCIIFLFIIKQEREQIYMWLIRLPEWSTNFLRQMKQTEMLMLHKSCTWCSIPFSSGQCMCHIEQQMGLLSLKSQLQ